MVGGYYGFWIIFVGIGLMLIEGSLLYYKLAKKTVEYSLPTTVYHTLHVPLQNYNFN
jgi:hypothetical protein